MQLEMSVTAPLYEKIKVADCLWYEHLLFKVVEANPESELKHLTRVCL